MGKIYPLSEKPSCYEATIRLIEASFQYKKPFSYEIDFAPLVDKSNHHNCFIMMDENDQVLAHVGVKERFLSLNGKKFSISMIGGISVDERYRGEGHFQELFTDVLAERRDETTLFLLWSDLEKLYNKFGFHLCGTQFEFVKEKRESLFLKTTFKNLSEKEKSEIKNLYQDSFSKTYLTLTRSSHDWLLLEEVTSADLYIRKQDNTITDYYFMNKGQDLPDIIYEYGTTKDIKDYLEEISHFGKVWMGKDILPTENLQYQFFMAPGDLKLFSDFIFEMTNHKFKLLNINLMKQEVFFEFNEETLSLELSDFLRGVFGPGAFEEIEVPTLFLSGLESV